MSHTLLVNPAVAAPVAVGLLPDSHRYGLSPTPAAGQNTMLPLDIPVPKSALRRRNAVVEAMLESNVLAALTASHGPADQVPIAV